MAALFKAGQFAIRDPERFRIEYVTDRLVHALAKLCHEDAVVRTETGLEINGPMHGFCHVRATVTIAIRNGRVEYQLIGKTRLSRWSWLALAAGIGIIAYDWLMPWGYFGVCSFAFMYYRYIHNFSEPQRHLIETLNALESEMQVHA